MKTVLRWNPGRTPTELRTLLRTLAEAYPLAEGAGPGLAVRFEAAAEPGVCEILREGGGATVRYGTSAQAGRAVGALLAGLANSRAPVRETTPFTTLGIMLDCSRNAVMTPAHVRVWLRRLALLGYNQVMLYTEDTYQLPGEPYFGIRRGAYSRAELRDIVAYAARLNIEIVPCIQTLGHLEKILRHKAYRAVKDTPSVLLVGEKKTYALIEKMIRFWKDVCRTDRIHIGMDETHDLGRGRYLDRFGYRPGFDLFNEHLARVVKLCRSAGFRPMIWSDMYFRLGCESGLYYDPATVIPDKVARAIPAQAELVYWDYYHRDKAFYLDWIERHRALGKEPLMASGIWTWNRYWYDHRTTVATAGPCIEACAEAKVRELIFTQWGDNGAYCDHDSAFAGMAYCADKAYGHVRPDVKALQPRFKAVCGGDYTAHLRAAELHGGAVSGFQPDMWDDPLFETRFRAFAKDNPARMARHAAAFDKLARELTGHVRDRAAGDMKFAAATARAFADRYALIAQLLAAYKRKDRAALKKAAAGIPRARRSVRAMARAFRAMWLHHNKPEGLETIQARFGMLDARYAEMALRLSECLSGARPGVAEWEGKCLP